MSSDWTLIAGLGNPGDRYTGTRHNVGFDTIDALAASVRTPAGYGIRVDRFDCRALVGQARVEGKMVLFAKPQTFMNLSGESVKGLMQKYEIDRERLLVIADDAALPLGRLRLRRSGSDGGQKGLRSIISCLGSEDFPRLRFGIAGETFRPGTDLSDYVLERFGKAEREDVKQGIERACEAVRVFLTRGIEDAMNEFNRPQEGVPAES
ncbi:MAG: aminoacyl-tRNA hydrolase [Acidobacteria bacterium]|nr:aminoacyl-tRNA hydrolase [Acidobacteriota bacterium]